MKSKRILSLLAVAALSTAVLVGCGSKEAAFKDGTYKEASEVNDKGYVSQIEIEVKDGKIATVKYDEVKDGVAKSADEAYNKMMLEKGSPSSPAKAFPELEASLIETQDVDAVDAVTGVTSSSDSFKTLAAEALKDAK